VNRPPPPLLGFNNNIRHRGRVFHIQTEDSGIKYCRVVTHLFADGGRILRTTRTDYSQQLETADFTEQIRRLMKEQHRAMFSALRAGEFDDLIKSALESARTLTSEGPDNEVPTSQRPALRAQELPPLSLPAPESERARPIGLPATTLISRPSNRPSRRSSRPPSMAPGRSDRSLEEANCAPRTAANASTSSARVPLGRPPMDSSECTRYAPTRSLFGDTDTSEPSLGEVILSYVEESTEKGSGRG